MVFLNEAELRSKIVSGLTVAVQSVVNEIHDENELIIEDVVYGGYGPSWYERTGDFGNAWDVEVGGGSGGVEGEFFYDPEGMNTSGAEDGQHVSIIDGSSVVSVMPEVIYQWGAGCLPRPTGRDAWKVLDSFLSNTMMRSMFEGGLNASGMPWKRSTGAISVTKTK